MKHFYDNIQGWFTFPNLYKEMVLHFPSGSHFAEIGVWKGKSACYMAVEIMNSKKNIRFDCIDTWEGSAEHLDAGAEAFEPELVHNKEWIWEHFTANIKPVKEIITPVRKHSLEAALLYEDNSLDFVFIDAAHDYINVTNDIKAWYPKVKKGSGVIAGHDYTWGPEVRKAADDFFGARNLAIREREGCWIVFTV